MEEGHLEDEWDRAAWISYYSASNVGLKKGNDVQDLHPGYYYSKMNAQKLSDNKERVKHLFKQMRR
jgi:hypothetical protein